MKNSTVTISFSEEKLTALRLYLGQKNQSVEDELSVALDSLYAKTVPTNVREFIELRAGTVGESKKRKPKPVEAPAEPTEPTPTDGDAP